MEKTSIAEGTALKWFARLKNGNFEIYRATFEATVRRQWRSIGGRNSGGSSANTPRISDKMRCSPQTMVNHPKAMGKFRKGFFNTWRRHGVIECNTVRWLAMANVLVTWLGRYLRWRKRVETQTRTRTTDASSLSGREEKIGRVNHGERHRISNYPRTRFSGLWLEWTLVHAPCARVQGVEEVVLSRTNLCIWSAGDSSEDSVTEKLEINFPSWEV